MNRWLALSGLVVLGVGAVFVAERSKVDVPPGPSAMLYLIADTEQELTRLPVRFTRLSDEEEIRIGDGLARYYGMQEEKKDDPETKEIQEYVAKVGAGVARQAHRKLPYKFHYLARPYLINAFALPGGHVYIGQGLINMMDSEDELASVLAHEVEHIDHYHCAERVQRERAVRKIPFGGIIALPMAIFEAGYTKDQELEADRDGTRLAVQAGYSANGAIRMFEKFQRLHEEYRAMAGTPQQEVTQVLMQTIEGYFRSHPLPSERIAQVQKLIASERWPARAERDLTVAYIGWTARADSAFAAHKYPQAQQLALRSLQMRPNQEKALHVLAQAQFAQADFAEAAKSYRRLLVLDHPGVNPDHAALFAHALAAADRGRASREFEDWLKSVKENRPDVLRVSQAGLALLNGDRAAGEKLIIYLNQNSNETWAPAMQGNLGWWYYRAGDYSTALGLLNRAVQQRPGEIRFTTARAWVQIENRTLADALQSLDLVYSVESGSAERKMARAVTLWLSQQPDAALSLYAGASNDQPEWNNPQWVKALYSPLVSDTLQQIQAEHQRRQKPRPTQTT